MLDFNIDKFSEKKFGENEHLTVLGWIFKDEYSVKKYVLSCDVCSSDKELFPLGSITAYKSSLVRGNIPCGCSIRYNWSEDQYKILCSRKVENTIYSFLGWGGDFVGCKTSCKVLCQEHGEYTVHSIMDFIYRETYGCYGCKRQKIKEIKRKPEDLSIASILSTGEFHENTKFWRSDRKNKDGWETYWNVYCPVCETYAEALLANLQRGHKPCECSINRQKQGYITAVYDRDDLLLAFKFGIAVNWEQRFHKQQLKSCHKLVNLGVWEFPTSDLCKRAERECMNITGGRYLNKIDMPDGWTETISPNNLETIIRIFENHGGIKI